MTPEDSGYEERRYDNFSEDSRLDSLLQLMDLRTGFTLGSPGSGWQRVRSRLTLIGHEMNLATWLQIVNEDDGLLIALHNESPMQKLREENLPMHNAPDLAHWSDAAYLQWKMCTSENARLDYVLRHHVINTAINDANAGERFERDNPPWPGRTYSTDTAEGQALLGTPNGCGVAYMLIQHRQELGHRKVGAITIFDFMGEMMMLFRIVDVEKEAVNQTASKPSQSNSKMTVTTRLPGTVKQINANARERSTQPQTDAEFEYESDEDEEYETDSSDECGTEDEVEVPLTDDEDEAMADEDYEPGEDSNEDD